jgi:general secretion pathway protein K
MRRSKNRGGALLTALFIMTLVAIVATAMSTQLQLDIYRTRLIITHDKLYLASQASTFWALSELNNKNLKFSKLVSQGMVDVYPKNMETIYNQIKISGGLYDLQARLNLNNLKEKKSIALLINLISHTIPRSTEKERINLVLALQDWLAPYDLSVGKDNHTSYYLAQKPPYYPSHQAFISNSEFRLIKDVSATTYLAMEPFITVLPEITPVNLNTASKQVLLGLGNGLSEAQVSELIGARGKDGITSMKDIQELIKKLDLPEEQITIESKYFLNVAHTSDGTVNLVVYTLLKRYKDKDGKLTVNIVRESMNGF